MKRKAIWAVVAVLAAALTGGWALLARTTSPATVITAQFEDSAGLYVDNAVAILGMKVGKITAITTRDSYVEVTMELNENVDVPADAEAVTVSTSLLTDRHIELTPPYRGGPKLKNGDILPLGRTRSPVEFSRTLSMVDKLTRSLAGDGKGQGPLADLVSIGDKITTGSGPQLKSTLDELSKALRLSSDHGAQTRGNIEAIVSRLAELTQSATDNDTAIREFGSNIRQLSDILADEHLGSGSTGQQLNQVLDQAVQLLTSNRDNLKNTVTDARTITDTLATYQRELAETLDLAPLTVDNVYNAIDPNAGSLRVHGLVDKVLFNSQMTKEICNLLGLRQLGCSTGTLADYGPDFGLTSMLDLMAQTS